MIYTDLDQVNRRYSLVYSDPPWLYWGSPDKDQAAGKHYNCMSLEELKELPVCGILEKNAVHVMWATSAKIAWGIELLEAWGTPFRSIFQVWIKTTQDGKIIHGQGVRPSFTKPTGEVLLIGSRHIEVMDGEFLLIGSTKPKGRTLPIHTESMPFNVLHPRGAHSEKPGVFRTNIETLFGPEISKIELFARQEFLGWDAFGNEVKPLEKKMPKGLKS